MIYIRSKKSLKEDIGIQTIKFHGDTTVDLRCISSLMIHQSSKKTIAKLQVINFQCSKFTPKLWNSPEYFDTIDLTPNDSQSKNIGAKI